MSDAIPYGRQSIDDGDIAAVAEVLRSDFLTTGPAVDSFESALADVTGAAHAVAVNSGTAALHAMYFAAGIGAGDEVVTSPLTFAATANAALYVGATVRFADVDPATGNLDADAVESLLGPRTRAVVAVDYGGHPADYDALRSVIGSRSVALLADAAHSLGATDRGRPVGTLADASTLSFHPVKPITTAEGGAVVSNDRGLADRVARFRSHGITRNRAELERDEGPWYYEQHDLGFNYRLTDLQAALGSSQLQRLGEFLARRRSIAGEYDRGLRGIDGLELPTVRDGVRPGWHLYVVLVRDASRRRAFFERLREMGIGVQVHYIPVYWHPYYRKLDASFPPCPAAEDRYARSVSLPIFPRLAADDLERVIDRVRTAARETL
jgi:UDP-4-amino-4,6-dideoxy-N-acetyl-beta-L-altrosamine transaminase